MDDEPMVNKESTLPDTPSNVELSSGPAEISDHVGSAYLVDSQQETGGSSAQYVKELEAKVRYLTERAQQLERRNKELERHNQELLTQQHCTHFHKNPALYTSKHQVCDGITCQCGLRRVQASQRAFYCGP